MSEGLAHTLPAGRYGPAPSALRRRLAIAAGAVLALVALSWLVWAALGQADQDVRVTDIGFVIVDNASVQVTYDVGKVPSATAICSLRALDRNKTAVGIAQVTIGPTSEQVTRRTDTIRTSALAVTGIVRECRLG